MKNGAKKVSGYFYRFIGLDDFSKHLLLAKKRMFVHRRDSSKFSRKKKKSTNSRSTKHSRNPDSLDRFRLLILK